MISSHIVARTQLLDNSGKDYNWFGVIFQWHIDQLWKSVDSLLAQKLTPSIVAIHYGIRNTILFKKYVEWMNLLKFENFINILSWQYLLCKKKFVVTNKWGCALLLKVCVRPVLLFWELVILAGLKIDYCNFTVPQSLKPVYNANIKINGL